MLTRGRLVPRQPRAIKGTTRTELRGETIMRATWLRIKGEMIWGILSYKIRQNTRSFDADYRVKWRKLLHKILDIELFLNTYHFTNYVNQCRR